ncbi:MAG: tRNA 2-thiouridine(34) synthase MnmA, partial [Actinomycetota bacterium]|nr:tRNA 2-thiouridine(34) synthase MnmA [Actinomycetota bacterium]
MPDERFADHLAFPRARDREPTGAYEGVAGGALCGDLITIALVVEGGTVTEAGFTASGCGASVAAGSAVVELLEGAELLEAARIGTPEVSAALGGLSTGKLHAADLAADAMHQALGRAARAHAQLAPDPERILVAMSGGVDSAVAALHSGPRAVAVTLELWRDAENDGERSCCSASAVRVARRVAHDMGLPHFTLDLREEFRAGVVDPWLADHAQGLTPNPCVRCNGHVRLDAMLAFAGRLGAPALATGHYARTTADDLVREAVDPAKDQSYMLARLDPATTRRLRFPLGERTKPEVRVEAERAGISVAQKPDSQDLCFLAGTGKERFLARHGAQRERPGDVVDRTGRRLGRHRGAHAFTVGQRRGLGVGGGGEPLYVLRTDVTTNVVTVGPREALATTTVPIADVVLHRPAERVDHVRLRSHGRAL